MVAKAQPLKYTEDILVFCNVGFLENQFKNPTGTYNPQMREGKGKRDKRIGKEIDKSEHLKQILYRPNPTKRKLSNDGSKQRFPKDVLNIKTQHKRIHPTQKPVELMEYLIKTYTNENETVLDFTMGSGSTGVAANNLNRDFIGIEQDEKYFKIAEERINKHQKQLKIL